MLGHVSQTMSWIRLKKWSRARFMSARARYAWDVKARTNKEVGCHVTGCMRAFVFFTMHAAFNLRAQEKARKFKFVILVLTFKNVLLYCNRLVNYVSLKNICSYFFYFFVCFDRLQINYVISATHCIGLCTYTSMLGTERRQWSGEGEQSCLGTP